MQRTYTCLLGLFAGIVLFCLVPMVDARTLIPLTFLTNTDLRLPEQDVFVPWATGTVMRIENGGMPATSTQKLYAAATAVPHDPFKIGDAPLGPFPEGTVLRFTLGQWLSGTASGTYAIDGSEATIDFSAANLVPNALYTVWCSSITLPPQGALVDRPCGQPDGSENFFTTTASGTAVYHLKLKTLQPSTKETLSAIMLAYQSDATLHGQMPGAFGRDTHLHLTAVLPIAEGNSEYASAAAVYSGGFSRVWLIAGVIGLIILLIGIRRALRR